MPKEKAEELTPEATSNKIKATEVEMASKVIEMRMISKCHFTS